MKRQALGTLVALIAIGSMLGWPGTPVMAFTRRPVEPDAPVALTAGSPSLRQLVGQKLVVAMHGTSPSTDLLGRIRRGEVGGVILFGANVASAPQLVSLTRRLQQAAATGGRPPLLIATDQEGGGVKRLSWAPPTLSPPQMGALNSTTIAASQGKATGRVLACAGINNNLAPVADVPSSTASFMYQEGRTFSFDSSVTASLSNAFATGLLARGILPAMKHFPGLGFATRNTDANVVTIRASKAALKPGLRPYRTAIDRNVPLIMLSNATYSAYDPHRAAGWSQAISVGLLRQTLGFTGISITDSLTGTAVARGLSAATLAIRAAQAGTDMVLVSGTESTTRATYAALLAAARDGRIARGRLAASYDRILATKARITPPPDDTTAPTVDAPRTALIAGGQLGQAVSPLRTTWSASDPCHISRYVLQRQTDGGAWIGQGPADGTDTATVRTAPIGSTIAYRLRATDGAGNTSSYTLGRPFRLRATQESGAGVSFAKSWQTVASSDAAGGGMAFSRVAGASATFTFSGYAVSWVAARGPHRGRADVYVDGHLAHRIDLHAATPQARSIAFARRWADNGMHTIEIVNLGTAGHPRVDVDAFIRLVAT
ncbi:MAG TPA: glycoside hydrolase family 3 N-terminal domain-containing protein [Candidatus Limnocylindria bacterium]|nr:glycoside hydrolase family 3 N-terminal domain-containing protein [Candidatus Limnocylindria bacterium]